MMVAQQVKLRAGTLIPTSILAPSTGILSVSETTNWFSVTLTSTTSSQLKPTIVNPAKKPWTKQQITSHGLVSSKSTPFWVKICRTFGNGKCSRLAMPKISLTYLHICITWAKSGNLLQASELLVRLRD